jgi:hypothetical protein
LLAIYSAESADPFALPWRLLILCDSRILRGIFYQTRGRDVCALADIACGNCSVN